MFKIGDYVINQKNGHIGKIIGYKHQILDAEAKEILKVLVSHDEKSGRRGFVEEDLYSIWARWPT